MFAYCAQESCELSTILTHKPLIPALLSVSTAKCSNNCIQLIKMSVSETTHLCGQMIHL